MKFEEHLNNNKAEFNHPLDKEKIWNQIDQQTKQAPSLSVKHWLVALSIVVGVLLLLYFMPPIKEKSTESPTHQFAQKQEMIHLANDTKTSNRIRAVSMTEEVDNLDHEIMTTLIERMQHDESTNVQLAALRALEDHIDNEEVRIAMIETLVTAKNSYLQIKLINLLSKKKEHRLLPYLENIINEKNDNSIILYPAEQGLRLLKS